MRYIFKPRKARGLVAGANFLFAKTRPAILIVDDDLAILRTFTRIFEIKGYSVTVAEKGREALEKLRLRRFDVALVDFGLPDMEGTVLFRAIEKSSPKTVKIMLTGKTQLQDTVQGVDAFVGKPVDPERLFGIIEKLKDLEAEK